MGKMYARLQTLSLSPSHSISIHLLHWSFAFTFNCYYDNDYDDYDGDDDDATNAFDVGMALHIYITHSLNFAITFYMCACAYRLHTKSIMYI